VPIESDLCELPGLQRLGVRPSLAFFFFRMNPARAPWLGGGRELETRGRVANKRTEDGASALLEE